MPARPGPEARAPRRPALTLTLLLAVGVALAPRPVFAEPDDDATTAEISARARKLIDIAGSADEADARLLTREVSKLPTKLLAGLEKEDIHFIVCRRSVADGVPLWKNEHVRGWPEGYTFDMVPGRGSASLRMCVIATVGHGTPQGPHIPEELEGHEASSHGSASLVFHELAHALDGTLDTRGSRRPGFLAAREADLPGLPDYEAQRGSGGREETYAESFARFYAGDPYDAQDHPNLHAFWATDPLGIGPPRPTRRDPEVDSLVRTYRALRTAFANLKRSWNDLEKARKLANPVAPDPPKKDEPQWF